MLIFELLTNSPASKRGVWDVIQKAKKDRCIVLTTHSMEEAESICQRIGIIARGQLKCIGTLIHLKNKYSQGYQLRVSCDQTHRDRVHEWMLDSLPNIELHGSFAGTQVFRWTQPEEANLSHVFSKMDKEGKKVGIKDWCIQQATLEEVFLKLAEEVEN